MDKNLNDLLIWFEHEILALKTTRLRPAMFDISSRTLQVSNYSPGSNISVWEYEIVFDNQTVDPLTFVGGGFLGGSQIIAPAVSDPDHYVSERTADVEVGKYLNGRQRLWITFDTTPNYYNGGVTIYSTGKIANIVRVS